MTVMGIGGVTVMGIGVGDSHGDMWVTVMGIGVGESYGDMCGMTVMGIGVG